MSGPRLIATRVPRRSRAAVIVLHGGGAREAGTAVSPAQLSVLRMVPVAARIAATGRNRLAVFRLLNSTRGWDAARTPVDDVRWALERVGERVGDLPVGLVGHSLGGRAALLAAPAAPVRSVVALAPWVRIGDATGLDVGGRRILVVHGSDDRVASPARAAAVATALARTGEVGFIDVEGANHAMLGRGAGSWAPFDRFAAQFATATLLGTPVSGPVGRVLAGETRLTV